MSTKLQTGLWYAISKPAHWFRTAKRPLVAECVNIEDRVFRDAKGGVYTYSEFIFGKLDVVAIKKPEPKKAKKAEQVCVPLTTLRARRLHAKRIKASHDTQP